MVNRFIQKELTWWMDLLRFVGSLLPHAIKIVLILPSYSLKCIHALAHPENKNDWRFAYAFFVVPVTLLCVLGGIGWILPYPWNWVGVILLCGLLAGEGYLMFVEGNGFEHLDAWIEGRDQLENNDLEAVAAQLANLTWEQAQSIGYQGDLTLLLFRSFDNHKDEFSEREQEKMAQIVELAAFMIRNGR